MCRLIQPDAGIRQTGSQAVESLDCCTRGPPHSAATQGLRKRHLVYEWVLSHLHPISGGFVGVRNDRLWNLSFVEPEGGELSDNESFEVSRR